MNFFLIDPPVLIHFLENVVEGPVTSEIVESLVQVTWIKQQKGILADTSIKLSDRGDVGILSVTIVTLNGSSFEVKFDGTPPIICRVSWLEQVYEAPWV